MYHYYYFVPVVIVLTLIWYYQRLRRMTLLERYGIPGPKPHLILGNMREYYNLGYNECFERWKKKYGRIFGYYLGAKYFIVVTDPELLKMIEVKDFNHFFHRPYVIPGGLYRNWKFHQQVNRVDAFRWKKMRQSMSPWFSSSQLKSMVPIIKLCTDEMIAKLEPLAQSGQEFNIYRIFEGLTMDTIHRSAFGIMSGVQKHDPDHNQLINAHRVTLSAKTSEFLASLLLCFPELSFVINPIRDIVEKLSDFLELTSDQTLWKSVEAIVDKRIEAFKSNSNDIRHKDIIELMIERLGDSKDKSLTKIEIIANAIGIDEAAYESPANNLGFVVHHLVNYPDIQNKVYEELDRVINGECDGQIDYETLHRLPYTEAVIQEAFRIYPTDPLFMSHTPESDYKYGSLVLPKGADIRIPTYQLHRDQEFWSEPNRFIPERFLGADNQKAINPFVYQPFGVGPRLCPGKRFTILEIKVILAKILLNYRLIAGELTEPIDGLELNFKLFSLSPKNGIFVRLMHRNED